MLQAGVHQDKRDQGTHPDAFVFGGKKRKEELVLFASEDHKLVLEVQMQDD